MLMRIPGFTLICFLLAACGSAPPAAAPPPSATPPAPSAAAPATTAISSPTPIPISYGKSMLLARWDSKSRHHVLLPVNPATGDALPGFEPIDLGMNYYHDFSPDHRTLALVSFPAESPSYPVLHMVDLGRWQEASFELDAVGWVNALSFSPDGTRLAIALSYQQPELLLFDLAHNAVAARMEPEYEIIRLHFTADGRSLMIYGRRLVERFTENEHTEGPARVGLLSAADLAPEWSAELSNVRDGIYARDSSGSTSVHQPGNGTYLIPGVAFAPEKDLLYIVHADEDKLTSVDFAKRSSRTAAFRVNLSWFERFLMLGAGVAHAKVADGTSRQAVLSPDGETIYTIGMRNRVIEAANGEWTVEPSWLNFQVLRASDATVMLEKEMFASVLAVAPDGSRLFLQSWKGNEFNGNPSTEIFDPGKGEFTSHYEGVYLSPARRMDGSMLLASAAPYSNSGQSTRMSIYDFETAELIAEWTCPTYANWITPP